MSVPDDLVTRCVNTNKRARYAAAVAGQGLGFVELRTPPRSLPKDDRGFVVLPPVELFGPDARPRTADVLSGVAKTTWGWPRW